MQYPDLSVPSWEQIDKWQKRWTKERITSVLDLLERDREHASYSIVRLEWFTSENGFDRWMYDEAIHENDRDSQSAIVDLRGFPFPPHYDLSCLRLRYSHLEGASLNYTNLDRTDLECAHLERATLDDADLSHVLFAGARLVESTFHSSQLGGCAFLGSNVSRAKFSRNCWDCVDIRDAIFIECMLDNVDIYRIFEHSAEGTNFSRSWFRNVHFCGLNLRGCIFQESNFGGAKFDKCDLGGARFERANIRGVQFLNCNLMGTRLRSQDGYAECSTDTFFGLWGKKDVKIPYLFYDGIPGPFKKARFRSKDVERNIAICSQVRQCFRENYLFHEASLYYYQEEFWRTAKYLRGDFREKAIGITRYLLNERTIGYGERPSLIIGSSIAVVLICAIAFFTLGFEYEVPSRGYVNMSVWNIGFLSADTGGYFLKCIRFSIENFTTLGFNIMRPAPGISHWIATIEGLVGVLFIALATVTWVRKAIRD
jgi:uncharacterized protein YjbI with pentapeptide repeats